MKIYSFALGKVKNPQEAEEIAQNTFYKAMLSRKSFEGRSGEYTWLCSIAKNLCNDYFRAEARKADFPAEEIGSKDRVDVIQKETSFEIHRILHEMREPYKEVFELRVFGELSFSEIARIFHKTESWARVTYHRARLKIKERMDENDAE